MSIHPYEILSQYGNDPRTRSMLAGRRWHRRSPFFPSFEADLLILLFPYHAIGALTSTWNLPKNTRYTTPSIPMLMSYAPIFTKHTSISYNFINFPHPKGPKPPRLPKSQVFLSRIRCIQAQPHGLPGIAIPIGAHDALSGLTTHELRGVPERKGIRKNGHVNGLVGKNAGTPWKPPIFHGKIHWVTYLSSNYLSIWDCIWYSLPTKTFY